MPKRQFYSKGASKFNKSEKFRSNDPGLSRDSEPEAKRHKTETEKPTVDGTKKVDSEGNAFWEVKNTKTKAQNPDRIYQFNPSFFFFFFFFYIGMSLKR